MKVRIKEKDYEYFSDYPDGWSFSARNHFKPMVPVGPHRCFVKRYEKKALEQVPGWQLLMNLKGKNESNLPRLHDIVLESGSGKDMYYVFFDYIEGNTLDKVIAEKE